jgi:hypothetical protein
MISRRSAQWLRLGLVLGAFGFLGSIVSCSRVHAETAHQFIMAQKSAQQIRQRLPQTKRMSRSADARSEGGRPILPRAGRLFIPTYIRGQKTCAANMARLLRANGIAAPSTARARDFLRWGRASGAVPGAVLVQWRGSPRGEFGHVQYVIGSGRCLNPSVRLQAWQQVPCARERVLGYRKSH